jgi:hypothetical protein
MEQSSSILRESDELALSEMNIGFKAFWDFNPKSIFRLLQTASTAFEILNMSYCDVSLFLPPLRACGDKF